MRQSRQHKYAGVQLLVYKSSSQKRRSGRKPARRPYRLDRLALLAVSLMALAALGSLLIWGAFQSVKTFLKPASSDTAQLEAFLEKEFGFTAAPSLLYYNRLDSTLLSHKTSADLGNSLIPMMPSREDTELKARLEQLFAEYGDRFKTHFYYYNPQDDSFAEVNGYSPVAAASVIKLPILMNYLLAVDENMMTIDSPLLYLEYHRAGGAGDLQYKPAGVDFPANHVAGQMIRISDNTCTNIMISALGGSDAVNRKLANLGLTQTRIRNWLPDLTGTNTISAYEMATILYNIEQGPLFSRLSRENGLDILKSTHNRRLLVSPLPEEAKVAHKTGDIGTSLGDSGIVYLPDGRRYYISIQVERPFNDYTPRDMIQRASRMIYDHVASQPNDTLLVKANGETPQAN